MSGCRICGNTEQNVEHVAREMMFGLRERFTYSECARCGCLQLEDVPVDLSRYYPPQYYSYRAPERASGRSRLAARVQDLLVRAGLSRRRHVARHFLGRASLVGRLLARTYTPAARAAVLPAWLVPSGLNLGLDFSSRILDIGSGSGETLLHLRAIGFSNLWGADPFVASDASPAPGVTILRAAATELTGTYDFIMLHHAFEHVPNPAAVLGAVRQLLRPNGHALIRTPVAGTDAWKRYGVDWVQLDAPRHLYVHTEESIRTLAGAAGLDLLAVRYDSTGFQFWGSEQYRRDIPLMAPESFVHRGAAFTRAEVNALDDEAERLNQSASGDQAAFYLRRPA